MKSLLTFIFGLLIINNTQAQLPAIIPQPVQIIAKDKALPFVLKTNTQIIAVDSLSTSASFLKNYLNTYYGIDLANNPASASTSNTIKIAVNPGVTENPDGYKLVVDNKNINITASSARGAFYGIQTLIQLLPTTTSKDNLAIPSVEIFDYPRFGYRGMHLDVSRHFFDVAFIKKYIDYLAYHKLNNFHWHLTDDQGWRIEIKKHPKLTNIGAWRNGTIIGLYPGTGNDGLRYGGYYTQQEVKDVIKYAADRYINVIPEIEMPAHSMAVLAAYPQFGTEPSKKYEVAQTWGIFNKLNNVLQPTEQTFKFLEEVLTEVMALFPSKYIHIGGDEGSKIWWKQSAVSQQIMKANGIKDESGLQSFFIHRIENFVNRKGKTIIGWDEILDGGLAPNAVVMSWRGEKGGIAAAKQKHKVIMTPEDMMYFNHSQFVKDDSLTAAKYLPLKNVYDYEPVPSVLNTEEAKYIWGGQANLWSEYIANPAKVEYMLFPRLDALSEILWSPKEKKNYPDFQNRLKTQFKRYDLMKINYSKRYLVN
ncbi:MAG: beta-N-acetylhexosaminidase [Candidatus Pedobacter colombiensis]|uniref:beta-N-acetylhexosaminidase n=1 Tax=Candidatus Pedobacter colombiensis TaxID=3121371 RepID=A0AAJ5WBV2_9SPHI|nr:beta-N-acetylhexosaminidase [Pedobacter sp.]WEK21771.1 MAG: beta-N-acetylhexosaminidase [Pedobacter sp.]